MCGVENIALCKTDQMHCAVLMSDFLSGLVCSVQVGCSLLLSKIDLACVLQGAEQRAASGA